MKTIYLYGPLAQFGDKFELDVRDVREALAALMSQIKGMGEVVKAHNWHIFKGAIKKGNDISEQELTISLGKESAIHIMPVVEGSNGVFQAIAGAIIFVVGVWFWNPYLMGVGASLFIGGAISLFTKVPTSDYANREEADQRPSFLYDGPTNTSTQGLPVPVIYGRIRTGSVVVSAGLSSEQI